MSYFYKKHNNTIDDLLNDLLSFDYNKEQTAKYNIISHDDKTEIQIAALGIDKEKIKIDIKDNILDVEYKNEKQDEGLSYITQEIFDKSFRNTFKLKSSVSTKDISASMNNGILKILIPKKKEKSASRIKIS